jgi:long-chain fatty acid transport protein
MKTLVTSILVLTLALGLAAAPARAGNGHFLHGVGAVNSSMGGAGVALPNDALGALHLNPALIARLDGHRMEFSVEQAEASNAVESRVGPFSGRTEEAGDAPIIPAFAWTRHSKGGSAAVGMGVLGLAGFGVDYPQDPGNPILAPQPFGFGRVFSNYQMMKIPFAVAWEVGPSLAVGASFNAGRASLTADPAGFAAADCTPTGNCFVPRVNTDSAFGYGVSAGLLWQATQTVSVGVAYSSRMDFEEFEWNSTRANPNRPDFGAARTISFTIDAPATAAVGIGLRPSSRFELALDAKMVSYEDTDGFGGSGVDAVGNAIGLGWEDILVYSAGVQYRPAGRLTLRAGYNLAENPIPANATFFNVTAPAIFEDHACVGLGFRVVPDLELNLGLYRAFENRSSGPFISPFGPVAGTEVTNEMTLDGALLTFSFRL